MKKLYPFTFAFWIFCFGIFFLTNGLQVIRLGPRSVHVWRQADCCSYALNYYQNQKSFLEPQTHTLLGKDGQTVSEFPILYYITGKLYTVFGRHHFILRGINFLIFLSGCTCLLWMCLGMFENKWLAFLPPVFVFTSPYLFYYGLNFLPDVPSFSLALMGGYFLFAYFRSKKLFLLYLFAAAFCLAGLLKISADIFFVACVLAVMLFREFRSEEYFKRKHLFHFFITVFLAFAFQLAWIQFAKHYNEVNGNGQNLLGVFPIWEASFHEFLSTGKRFLSEWLFAILHPLVWLFVFCSAIIFRKKIQDIPKFIGVVLLLTILGSVAYSILWFKAYYAHDYYMINPFIALVWLVIAICVVMDKETFYTRKYFGIAAIAAGILAVVQVRQIQHSRYNDGKYVFLNPAYFEIEPYMRSLGIIRTEKVVSVPDISPNITLYYLNNPGWTEAFNSETYNINYFAANGAKYLVVGDKRFLSDPLYKPHMDSLVGTFWDVQIYKMK